MRVVVITGASAGVGRATVQAFAKEKAAIALLSRNEERLNAAKKEVENLGGKALVIPLDVSNATQIEMATDKIEQELGPIDVWINNAMVSVFSPAKEMTSEEYKRVTEVTYLGYVYGTLSALKRMLPRDKGMVIQVGSALAYRGIPLQSAYCAAKHAVQGFTESVRCELIHDNSQVKITMIQMPALNTPQFSWVKSRLPKKPRPVPPIFQPEVAAEAILWASKHYRRQYYVGMSTNLAIIGNNLFPWLGDWYLAKKGYEAQQYNGLDDSNRPNNLFQTVEGNYSAHGNFDDMAKEKSFQLELDKWKYWIFALILLIILFIFLI